MLAYVAKAVTALVMALLTYLSMKYGVDVGLDEATVDVIVTGLLGATPLAVWAVPNGPKPAAPPSEDRMRKVGGLCLLLLLPLGACAANLDVRWAQAQSAYNEAVRQAIAARKPCVEKGEADPGCLIKAEHYPKVDAAIRAGDAILRAVENGAPIRDATINGLLDAAAEIVVLIPAR